MTRRIDAYSLRLLVAAANEGSIARAAAREHIAASALSRRLSELERAFGVPLLVRSTHGIALTEAGRVAYERGLQFEHDLDALLRDVQACSGAVSGVVRLHANASSIIGFLPERLKRFSAGYPLVSIELQERVSADVARACLDDVADVGIAVADPESTPAGLDAWHFASDPLIVVLPREHALRDRTVIRLADALAHPLVCVQLGGALDRTLQERAAAAGLPLRVAVAVNSFDAVCRMVEAGLGIAIVTASAATAYAGSEHFERRPLEEPWARRELRLMALRKTPRAPAVDALIEALRG